MSNPISATTRARFGASIVALAPAVMLVGLFAHPYIATLPDSTCRARPASWHCGRWHTRCGSVRRQRDPRDSRDQCRLPDGTSDLRVEER